jgi:hypothetical protein
MAKLNRLDINAIPATGKNSLVTKEYVINFMNWGTKSTAVASTQSDLEKNISKLENLKSKNSSPNIFQMSKILNQP